MRQDLRCVLSVAMQQHHDIESFVDEIPVTRLLISAVTQVVRMMQDVQFGEIARALQSRRQFEGRILTGVIKNRHFFDVLPDRGGDALQNFGQSVEGVIGDD